MCAIHFRLATAQIIVIISTVINFFRSIYYKSRVVSHFNRAKKLPRQEKDPKVSVRIRAIYLALTVNTGTSVFRNQYNTENNRTFYNVKKTFSDIEMSYNDARNHASLCYISPVVYKRCMA